MPDSVNLKKSYAALNEKLIKLFDESGVRRTFTVPYIDGQKMSEHVDTVGAAAAQSGGLTNNLIVSVHHSTGKGWGSGDGHTVAHPAEKLRNTIIQPKDENAIAVIGAAQKHLKNLSFLLGDDNSDVQSAQNQLDIIKKADGAGMSLLDFGTMMTQMMYRPTQAVARAHSGTKDGGHAPQLRGPAQETAQQPEGEAPAGSTGETASAAPEAAPGAAGGQEAPAGGPVAQG